MTNPFLKRFGAAMIVGAVALAGCDDSPTDTDPPTPPAAAEVEVTPGELTLTSVGATADLSATVLDQEGQVITGASVAWTSSDESVVVVAEDGTIEVVGEGTAVVTATSGDASTTVEIVVEIAAPVAETIEVTPDAVLLTEIGGTTELSAAVYDGEGVAIPGAVVTWSSSDEAVVTVSEDGELEATGEGTATITAQSGDASATAEVVVDLDAQVAQALEVTPEEVLFTVVGETHELTAIVLDADGMEIPDATVSWSSSDEAVVTVSEEGELEAVGEGSATITATSGDVEATVEVTVEAEAVGAIETRSRN